MQITNAGPNQVFCLTGRRQWRQLNFLSLHWSSCQRNVINLSPSWLITPSSINFGILNSKANRAADAAQKATRRMFIISATCKAQPFTLSAMTQLILLPSKPLILSMSSSNFFGMTLNIASHNFPRSFLSSQASIPNQANPFSQLIFFSQSIHDTVVIMLCVDERDLKPLFNQALGEFYHWNYMPLRRIRLKFTRIDMEVMRVG